MVETHLFFLDLSRFYGFSKTVPDKKLAFQCPRLCPQKGLDVVG